MATSIEETLRDLDSWYRELPGGNERPYFISKLAILELCGWLELRMDEIVKAAATICGIESSWIEENVIARNYGFTYPDHFRPMLCTALGAACVQRIEEKLDQSGGLDTSQLKSILGTLWKTRGSLAHTHVAGVPKQQNVNAPSWCINQQRIVSKVLIKYEAEVTAIARKIGAMP